MDAVTMTLALSMVVVLILLTGGMMAITPFLMKRSECFAVTVPESAQHDPYLKEVRRRYLVAVLLVTVLMTVLSFVTAFIERQALWIALYAGMPLIVLFGYGMMLHCRSKVRAYKREQSWIAERQETVAVAGDSAIPKAISLKWNLLFVPVIALALVIGTAGYAAMPEQIPLQMGLDGRVLFYAVKSPFIVCLPALIQTALALLSLFGHWVIRQSKRATNPQAPATSALAYGLFAHAKSVCLLAVGMLQCVLILLVPLSFIGAVSFAQACFAILAGCIVGIMGSLAVSVIYGQGGSRVFARMQASSRMAADEDCFWKLGVFYFNREDSSLFLLERFGVGWTLNFARPAAWLILAAALAVLAVFIDILLALF